MILKEFTFENLPEVYEITLDVLATYYHLDAKTDGLPENCYPDETEVEVELDKGYKDIIMAAYTKAALAAIEQIEKETLEFDEATVKEWIDEQECEY